MPEKRKKMSNNIESLTQLLHISKMLTPGVLLGGKTLE